MLLSLLLWAEIAGVWHFVHKESDTRLILTPCSCLARYVPNTIQSPTQEDGQQYINTHSTQTSLGGFA